jgi:hypothetical protein
MMVKRGYHPTFSSWIAGMICQAFRIIQEIHPYGSTWEWTSAEFRRYFWVCLGEQKGTRVFAGLAYQGFGPSPQEVVVTKKLSETQAMIRTKITVTYCNHLDEWYSNDLTAMSPGRRQNFVCILIPKLRTWSHPTVYHLLIQHSHGKWPREIDGLPIKNGDLPWLCES